MKNTRPIRTRGGFTLAAVALLVLAANPASAKKPPKPPPDPVDSGVVYIKLDGDLYTMEPDGDDKTSVGISGKPSAVPHGGERWFLQVQEIDGEQYPSGDPRHEVFAVTASGKSVQVTDDESVEPLMPWGEDGYLKLRWATDNQTADGKISYVGRRWTETGAVEDVGLYVATIDLGDWSNHTPQSPSYLAVDTHVFDDPDYGEFANIPLNWSPDGTQLVYHKAGGPQVGWTGLVRVDADGTNKVQLTYAPSHDHSWSPKGDRIMAVIDGDIITLKTDGTDLATVIEDPADSRRTEETVSVPCWSPNATHIVYIRGTLNLRKLTFQSDIYRAKLDGSGATNLTADTNAAVGIAGWLVDG